jgi:predicted secreted Zn-dependent protease
VPRFDVRSFHSTRYYQVSGSTQEEIWAQLHSAANPLARDRSAGVKPLGHASFQYRYDYRSAFAESSSSCRIESATLNLRFETVLPRLAGPAKVSERLGERWLPLQELITEHEAGHHAIYRRLVTQLPQVMSGLGAVPCHQLDEQVRLAVEDAVAAVRRASADYDEHNGDEAYLATSL